MFELIVLLLKKTIIFVNKITIFNFKLYNKKIQLLKKYKKQFVE